MRKRYFEIGVQNCKYKRTEVNKFSSRKENPILEEVGNCEEPTVAQLNVYT